MFNNKIKSLSNRTFILILHFTFLITYTNAQTFEPDSLLQTLKLTQESSKRIELAKQLAIGYYKHLQYDSAAFYANRFLNEFSDDSLTIKDKQDFLRCKFLSLRHLRQYRKMLETLAAFEATDEGLPLSNRHKYLMWSTRHYGQVYLDSLMQAYVSLEQALVFAKKLKGFHKYDALLVSHIEYANLYERHLNSIPSALNSIQQADKYWHLAVASLEREPHVGLYKNKILIFRKISSYYSQLGKVDSALHYSNKLFELMTDQALINTPAVRCAAIYERAELLIKSNNLTEGFSLAKESVELADSIQNKCLLFSSLINLAKIYSHLEQNKLAKVAAHKALELNESSCKDPKEILLLYRILAQLELNSNPEQAALFQQYAFELSDSMFAKNQRNEFIRQEAALQFALERQDLEYQQVIQDEQIKRQRLNIYATILIILFTLFIAFMLFRVNQQQRKQNAQLLTIQKQLITSNARLSRFVNSVSHDIIGGLNTIVTSSNFIKQEDLKTRPTQKYYKQSRETATWLRNYCHELLVWSEEDTTVIQPTKVHLTSLEKVVKDIIHHRRQELEQLKFNVTIGELPAVYMSSAPLCQIMQNLIDNAIKYSKHRDTPKLKIAATSESNDWIIMVKDNGVEIPREKHNIIFEETKDDESLHGRGLSYVKRTLTEYDEMIWVDSNEWDGTSFYFTLRLNT